MTVIELLGRALDQTGVIVDGVMPDQMDLPACGEWDVQTVIAHLVRGNQNAAAAAEGRPRQPNPIADDVGDDPKGAYRASAEDVKRAWKDPSQLDLLYETALGKMPGAAMLSLRLSDNVTHGWDLARATGQSPDYDEEVVAAALAFAERQLGGNRPPGGPFAPPVPVSGDAPAIDRLAAFLGRAPS